jgi:hypothetical protein
MAEKGPELDFMTEIAVNYPLYVILTLLGLPESDFPRMLKLTQEMFGGNDEEFQRGGDVEDMLAVLMDFFNYFSALTASRRGRRPRTSRRRSPTRRSTETVVGHGHPVLLRDHGQRRARHHQRRHRRGPARAAGASRPAGPAAE